jgi:hypothetical protein
MVASGSRPVLAGRHQGRLTALAEQLSRAGDGIKLETAVAGSEAPGPLRELIGVGDVLVSTAGPFLKVGRSAVEAAVDAGAVYLDSTGEPPFIRQVFEEFGPRAEHTGAVLLTAFGYDYVPGNLAGALALQAAGPAATRVRVGYFARGNTRKATSAGTRASVAGVLLEPGYSFRSGRLVTERTAAHVASFEVDGGRRQAFSIGSSEHFALPRLRRRGASIGDDAYRCGRLRRLVRRRDRTRALRLGARGALGALAGCRRCAGSPGPPDSAQPGDARRRGNHSLRRRGRGGRRPWPSPRDGTPDRRGSVLVHRVGPGLGSEQGSRARRAARRRARPGGSIRSHQPRRSLRRGRIPSKDGQEGRLMDATYATKGTLV